MKNYYDKYILDQDLNPVPELDLLTWAKWFEEAGEKRIVGRDSIGEYDASTVFLGLNHQFGDGEPLLYESMVFEKKVSHCKPTKIGNRTTKGFDYHEQLKEDWAYNRYHTREQALAGHAEIMEKLKNYKH